MRKFRLLYLGIILTGLSVSAQTYNEKVAELITEVNLDSLISYVRILSGEDSVVINDQKVRIETRRYNSSDKFLAADYIFNKLTMYGLLTEFGIFNGDGKNVIGLKLGDKYPEQFYIICAHYDAVTSYCADDNASGSAAVIEAARVLSNIQTDYSIIFALWDMEEIGLVGSDSFVDYALDNDFDIKGVINMDMIGYDNDDDGMMEIHTREVTNGSEFIERILSIESTYNIGLTPTLELPGTLASDHASFIRNDIPAVLFIEAYYNGDFNEFYHSPQDRIDKFNLEYFHKMSQFSLAALADFVLPSAVTDVPIDNLPKEYVLEQNFPNPFNPTTVLSFSIPQSARVTLVVYDILGNIVAVPLNENKSAGRHQIQFDGSFLSSGTYFYTLKTGDYFQTQKMLLVK
jgi:hypothetical protein